MQYAKLRFYLLLATLLGFTCSNGQDCNSGKLDPRIAAFLKFMPKEDTTLDDAAVVAMARKQGPPNMPYPQADVQRIKVTRDSIPVLVFNPNKGTKLPVIIDLHGGGFILPLMNWMEYGSWKNAKNMNAVVFAVDYRVAPEHKFPAAVNDAYNAFKWIASNAGGYGGDTSRIVLMGNSAGANLTAVVTHKAKQEGIVQKIKLQVLTSPATDVQFNRYASFKENGQGYFMTQGALQHALRTYTSTTDHNNPDLSPMLHKDFSGLPPAVIFITEFDPLRDDGIAYANKLKAAGVPIWLRCFPGQIHSLIGLPPNAPEYIETEQLVLAAMKELGMR